MLENVRPFKHLLNYYFFVLTVFFYIYILILNDFFKIKKDYKPPQLQKKDIDNLPLDTEWPWSRMTKKVFAYLEILNT